MFSDVSSTSATTPLARSEMPSPMVAEASRAAGSRRAAADSSASLQCMQYAQELIASARDGLRRRSSPSAPVKIEKIPYTPKFSFLSDRPSRPLISKTEFVAIFTPGRHLLPVEIDSAAEFIFFTCDSPFKRLSFLRHVRSLREELKLTGKHIDADAYFIPHEYSEREAAAAIIYSSVFHPDPSRAEREFSVAACILRNNYELYQFCISSLFARLDSFAHFIISQNIYSMPDFVPAFIDHCT